MDKVTSSIELKISQRIENAFWQSLKAEVNRSIIWKLTILPFFEKMGQDLSYTLYFEIFFPGFFVFEGF